jgi:hypothetical protein
VTPARVARSRSRLATRSVSIRPAATALTSTFLGPSSMASDLVRAITPARNTFDRISPSRTALTPELVLFTIQPPSSGMRGRTARITRM